MFASNSFPEGKFLKGKAENLRFLWEISRVLRRKRKEFRKGVNGWLSRYHILTLGLSSWLQMDAGLHYLPERPWETWGGKRRYSSSPQFSSVAQSCLTLCDPMDCSTPGFPVLHHLPELAQTHVHWVSDAIQSSHPLLSLSPSAFNFPSIRIFSNESALHIRWSKYWSFSINWLVWSPCCPRDSQESSPTPQLKASILWCSASLIVQLSHPYMTTGKTIAFTGQTFVGKVISLLFNMMSKVAITFLQKSNHLLISWLQSPSAVILESKK